MFLFLMFMWIVGFLSFKQIFVIYIFMFISWLYKNWSEETDVSIYFGPKGDDDNED